MARPKKTRKLNHGGNSTTTMEDLDDHMLTQILFRLPSSATILACSLVNKHWCSLISDPNFKAQFANHKNTTTLLKGSDSDHEDDEPPWTFITTIRNFKQEPISTEFIFGVTPKLSLDFLPCSNPTPRATFKDLVLCFDYPRAHQGHSLVYYIANPLTKQWVALPPRPFVKGIANTALICEPNYNHTQNYKLRVVEVFYPREYHGLGIFDLVVYCSEIGKWKQINNLKVFKEIGPKVQQLPEIVVCNGLIYFKSGLRLVALNPFDINDTYDTTLEARVMPTLPNFGYLKESSGRLLVLNGKKGCGVPGSTDNRKVELEMVVWKLDPNQAPLVWEPTFQGLCKGTVNSIDLPDCSTFEDYIKAKDMGVHPYNDKLIYVHLFLEKLFVLCDTRTGCITSSKSFPNLLWGLFRLEHQWWPTSVPALVH